MSTSWGQQSRVGHVIAVVASPIPNRLPLLAWEVQRRVALLARCSRQPLLAWEVRMHSRLLARCKNLVLAAHLPPAFTNGSSVARRFSRLFLQKRAAEPASGAGAVRVGGRQPVGNRRTGACTAPAGNSALDPHVSSGWRLHRASRATRRWTSHARGGSDRNWARDNGYDVGDGKCSPRCSPPTEKRARKPRRRGVEEDPRATALGGA